MKSSHFIAGKQGYRPDIDGLKGLAILLVFVFHYASNWVPGGFVGVDVFLVVSGYLIGRSVDQSIDAKKFKLSTYFANRAKRIFPSLIFMLGVLWGFAWFAFLPKEFASLGKHIGGASVFISNWILWREVGYFDIAADLKPLLNLWSLGVEEQFYLVFPLLVFLSLRLKRQVLPVLALIFIGTLVASEINIKDMRAWAYFHPLSRLWELLAGSILAYAEYKWLLENHARAKLSGACRQIAGVAGIGLLVFAAFGYSKATVFPGAHALVPVLGAALIITAGSTAFVNRYCLSRRSIVYVGLISYPLYLWHWPLISVVRVIDRMEPTAGLKVLLALMTLGLSLLSYHLLENPIRFGRFSKRKLTPVVLYVLLLTMGAIGFATYKHNGFPERFQQNAQAQQTTVWPTEKGKVVLVGDSNGQMLEGALDNLYGKAGYNLVGHSQGGCLPLLNLDRHDPGAAPAGCAASINKWFAEGLNNPEVQEVLVIGRFHIVGNVYDITKPAEDAVAQGGINSEAIKWAIVERQLEATVKMFDGKGKKLTFFHVIPHLDFDPGQCESRPVRILSRKKEDCAISRQVVMEEQREYRAIFERIKNRYDFVTFFDPVSVLCDQTACYAEKDGALLYKDDGHLNEAGAELVLKAYKPR